MQGCLDQFADDEIELLSRLSAAADRPLNWNVLTIDSREPDRVPRQLGAGDRAAELGGRLVALTMPVGVPMNMSFLNFCALWLLPGWKEVMERPVPERIEKLRDGDTRVWMLERALSQEAGVFRRLADFGDYRIGDVYSEENEPLRGRVIREIAAERGKSSFGTLLDIVIADDLRTVLWPVPEGRRRRVVGPAPAGVERLRARSSAGPTPVPTSTACAARPYTTRFLGDCLRGRKLVSLERAVQLITSEPANLFGLRDRGMLREGALADVVVFDPDTIDSEDAMLVRDLPGDSARLTAGSRGITTVLVNGTVIVEDGKATGATPGTVLRSGRDTDTVTASAGTASPA